MLEKGNKRTANNQISSGSHRQDFHMAGSGNTEKHLPERTEQNS
jgi:hypothetical protein